MDLTEIYHIKYNIFYFLVASRAGLADTVRDRDSKLKNPGSGTGTGTQICGTRDSGTQLWGTVPGTKEFRDSVPVPCRPLLADISHVTILWQL